MRFSSIEKCIEYSKTHDITNEDIYLSFSKITEIPEDWNPQCKTLSLSDNNITKIPEKWNPHCNDLYLENNQITEIPEKWNPHCNDLHLNQNQITEIPEKWNPQCKYLSLNDNQITKIPEKWNPQCNYLILSSNQITEIPEKWNPLCKILDIHDNISLDKIPDKWNPSNIGLLYLNENTKIPLNEYILVYTFYSLKHYAKINNIPNQYINNKICHKCKNKINENDYYIIINENCYHTTHNKTVGKIYKNTHDELIKFSER